MSIWWGCLGAETGSATLSVDMFERRVELHYVGVGVGGSFDQVIYLTSLPSNLGKGSLWYFICPVTHKRCRKLYRIGHRFVSRFAAGSIRYRQQTTSVSWRPLLQSFRTINARDELREFQLDPKSRRYYRGRKTRRFESLIRRANGAIDAGSFKSDLSSEWSAGKCAMANRDDGLSGENTGGLDG